VPVFCWERPERPLAVRYNILYRALVLYAPLINSIGYRALCGIVFQIVAAKYETIQYKYCTPCNCALPHVLVFI
jgi:hypothetical protein